MTSPVFIIDTNVIVAALLTGNPGSPVATILDAMLTKQFPFLLSSALLDEYRSVLLRERIVQLHGLTENEIDDLLQDLVMNAIMHEPATSASAPDPGDDHLFSLLASWHNAVLVTGDQLLIDSAADARNVMSPRDFVSREYGPADQ